MSGARCVFDGLWRCLAPSSDPITAHVILNAPLLPAATTTFARRRTSAGCGSTCSRLSRTQCRRYSEAVAASPTSACRAPAARCPPESPVPNPLLHTIMRGRPNPPDLDEGPLRAASTAALLEALHDLQSMPHSLPVAIVILEHLLRNRGEKLSPLMYESLVACARDTRGSADTLAQALFEMRKLRFGVGARLCHMALQVLAIHPNYLIRNEILQAMNESWTETDVLGQCSVALGLLREGQYELALDKFESTTDEHKAAVPPWMFDIFILVFMQRGFLDEAVRLAQEKMPIRGEDVALPLWSQLLDACSRAFHFEGTSYIWRRFGGVDKSQVSDGTLLNVLNTAARHNDPAMAAGVIHLLSTRGSRLGSHHYEALIDAYAGSGDLPNALRVVCIMYKALSNAPEASTRPIYERLRAHPVLLDDALEALASLSQDYKVPVEAANAVLEAAVATDEHEVVNEMHTYWKRFTAQKPNLVTYRHFMNRCSDVEILKGLVAGNPRIALKADPDAFKRAIHEFALAGELDSAYACTKLLSAKSGSTTSGSSSSSSSGLVGLSSTKPITAAHGWLPRETAMELVKKSLDAQDERVWALLEEAKRRGVDVQSGLSRFVLSAEEGNAPSRSEVTKGRRVAGRVGDEEGNITLG